MTGASKEKQNSLLVRLMESGSMTKNGHHFPCSIYEQLSWKQIMGHCLLNLLSAIFLFGIFCQLFRSVTMEGVKDVCGKTNIAVGPWGGYGGTSWDDGSYHGVKEIRIQYGRCIDSISILYEKNGKPVQKEQHGGVGGVGGHQTAEIKFNYPDEHLVSVSGHYSPVVRGGSPVIRSLTFKSNRRTFGPYGVEEGTPFSFPMEGGKIVGFRGRSGWYLDAIGFYLSPVQSAGLKNMVRQLFQKSNLDSKTRKEPQTAKNAKAHAR